MALIFLYLAFVRMLQLFELRGTGRDELAIGVVVLHHELAILRRQVDRPGRHRESSSARPQPA